MSLETLLQKLLNGPRYAPTSAVVTVTEAASVTLVGPNTKRRRCTFFNYDADNFVAIAADNAGGAADASANFRIPAGSSIVVTAISGWTARADTDDCLVGVLDESD